MKRCFPPAALTALFVLFRLPALLNSGLINADGAIAGLQARRMLEGEWEWHHWGRDYLISIDSVMATPFFALFGSTPLVLMCVTLLGQLTFTWLAYSIVSRRLGPWPGFVATLPLAFMTMALNIYLFFDIRQWCVVVVLLAFWVIDRAAESRRPSLMLFLGMVLVFGSLFVDLFAVQFMPGLILFAILSALDGTLKIRPSVPRLGAVLIGAGAGFCLLQTLRGVAHLNTSRAQLSPGFFSRNWPLLGEQCLPWLIGAKVFAMSTMGGIEAVQSPFWLLPVQFAGALVFGIALLSGAALFFVQRIPWRVRVLGAVGSGVACTSLCGFLLSGTAEDIMGARLLLPVIVTLPFTLAPVAFLAGSAPRFALVISPYLLMTAIGGWLSYGAMVEGPLPARTVRGSLTQDLALAEFLRSRGVQYAAANYWIAYRLSFVLDEKPIVVPEGSEDRYPRWRREFDAQRKVAYLTDAQGMGVNLEELQRRLFAESVHFEKFSVEGYQVLIVEK